MKELQNEVEKIIQNELNRANGKFSLFNSTHEGYAVIKEEIEESNDEMGSLKINLGELWEKVKVNSTTTDQAKSIYTSAMLLACEAIQAAAMARKFTDSIKKL